MKKQKHLIIAGGTGFLGTLLANHFCARFERITLLTRHARPQKGNIHYVEWDAQQPGPWMSLLDGSDALINLTGKSVHCRYTEANKQAILDSRIHSTLVLGAACIMAKEAPHIWINSSSATIYRDARDRAQDEENGQLGDDFSPTVCKQWEETFFSIPLPRTRKVAFRTALVLGEDGGAYPLFRTLTRLGLGGKAGSGNQMVSWIHELDFIRSVEYALDKAHVEGIYNCCAPEPVNNRDFMRTLRKTLRVPFGLPATEGMLKLASVLLGTESELLLKSRWVIPHRLQSEGFSFRYASLNESLKNLAHHDIQPLSAVRLETAL